MNLWVCPALSISVDKHRCGQNCDICTGTEGPRRAGLWGVCMFVVGVVVCMYLSQPSLVHPWGSHQSKRDDQPPAARGSSNINTSHLTRMSSETKSQQAAATCTSRLLSLPPELFILIVAELDCEEGATLIACSRALTQAYVPLLVTLVFDNGESLLTGAIAMGFYGLARTLLTHGADPNVTVSDHSLKFTLLHHAASRGDVTATRLLLEFGADTNLVNDAQQLPMHVAAECSSSNVELVRVLLEAGAEFTSADNKGCTPLHIAASENGALIIELLADAGASLDVGTKDGATPLGMACVLGHADAVGMLLRKGADVEIVLPGRLGTPPIVLATSGGYLEIVKTLIEAGASRDLGAMTSTACRVGHVALLKVLLGSSDEDVRRAASFGLLMAMMREGDGVNKAVTETVQVLLDAGIVVDKATLELATRMSAVSASTIAPRKLTDVTEMLGRYDADLAVPSSVQ
jgi:ankyrin repeat protein